MDLQKLNKIKEQLDKIDCKSYELTIKCDDNNAITLNKKELENEKVIGFITK
jgi:hypothetical protein